MTNIPQTPPPSPDASRKTDPAGLQAGIAALNADIRLVDAADLAGYDPGSDPRNFDAGLLALPGDTRALQALVAFCQREGVAIVPQGGRTGLVGGTVSRPGTVAVSTARLNRILAIDPLSGTAVVEAGVTLQAVQEAAAEYGLEPGIDLGARGTATIGGMVATNAGGIQAFRHGVMRHRVLGLEAVLADGSLFSDLTQVVKSTSGYDVKQLFIGSEGTLGIVTRIVLQLVARPKAQATVLLALPDAASGLRIARRLQAEEGGALLACEMMWQAFLLMNAEAQGMALSESFAAAPASLLIELAGPTSEAAQARIETIMEDLWAAGLVTDAMMATSEARRAAIWHLREDMSVFGRLYPGYRSFDISLPPAQIGGWLATLDERLGAIEPGLTALVFAHVADGNLHVIPRRGNYDDALKARVEAAIYQDLIGLGGAISAEHGIGQTKQAAYDRFVPEEKRRLVALMKTALDPRGLFNPGKILPAQDATT